MDMEDILTSWIFWIIVIFVLIIVGMDILDDSEKYDNVGEPYIEEAKICAIKGLENNIKVTEEMKGFFILGIGTIKKEEKEAQKYYYFKVTEYGMIIDSIDIDSVYIRENDKEPSLIKAVKKQKKRNRENGDEREIVIEEATILQVPINTIKIDYNIEI